MDGMKDTLKTRQRDFYRLDDPDGDEFAFEKV
jgi:hypothetical protein